MTTLNSRLQLAILKTKKTKKALEKGFTLVELLIVVVILGVLSAVALPNFLNQADKAKANAANTEAKAAANAFAQATITGDDANWKPPANVSQKADGTCADGSTGVTFTVAGGTSTTDDQGNTTTVDALSKPAIATVCGTGVELTQSAEA